MKTAFLYGLIALVGSLAALVALSFAIEAVWHVRFNEERLAQLTGRISWFLAFVAFVIGWIRQANRRKTLPPPAPAIPTPENLEPIDYSKLSQLYDDEKKT